MQKYAQCATLSRLASIHGTGIQKEDLNVHCFVVGVVFGADDFLPCLTWVLLRSDVTTLQVDTDYMMELLDPTQLQGEGRRCTYMQTHAHVGTLPWTATRLILFKSLCLFAHRHKIVFRGRLNTQYNKTTS